MLGSWHPTQVEVALSTQTLYRRSQIWTTVVFVAVVFGALVTSSEAGQAAPVWPLSGWLSFQPGVKGLHALQSHRYLGVLAALLTFWVALAARQLGATRPASSAPRLANVAMGLAGLQVFLGLAMSAHGLPPGLTFLHGMLAQGLFCVAAGLTAVLRPSWSDTPFIDEEEGAAISLKSIATVTVASLSLQILLGALHRHGLLGLIPHVALAMVLGVLVMFACIAVLTNYGQHAMLKRSAYTLLSLFLVQILLGVAAYLGRITLAEEPGRNAELLMIAGTVAHVITGALTIGSSLVFALQILKNVRPSGAGRAANSPSPAVSS